MNFDASPASPKNPLREITRTQPSSPPSSEANNMALAVCVMLKVAIGWLSICLSWSWVTLKRHVAILFVARSAKTYGMICRCKKQTVCKTTLSIQFRHNFHPKKSKFAKVGKRWAKGLVRGRTHRKSVRKLSHASGDYLLHSHLQNPPLFLSVWSV